MTRTSGTVGKALDLLDLLVAEPDGLTLSELARRSGIHKSSVLRLCATLEQRGYLSRTHRGAYCMGARVTQLAQAYQSRQRLEALVRPSLLALRDHSGESAAFYVPDGDMRVCLYRENALHAIRHHVEEGTRFPLAEGAVGRVLLAWSSTPAADSETIRRDGYLISDGREPFTASVAAPVFGPGDELLGAVVVSGLASRFTAAARERVRVELVEVCGALTRRLQG
ncbi:MAG: IclR family transcriptional regulator [Gammaproteobacteria bacterium]|nr:IclR family transcriptional regulator [Gammaproteobacteria bacterium]